MKQISNKEYEAYGRYKTDKLHGRILTPDGLSQLPGILLLPPHSGEGF